jgi:hypothetical protein
VTVLLLSPAVPVQVAVLLEWGSIQGMSRTHVDLRPILSRIPPIGTAPVFVTTAVWTSLSPGCAIGSLMLVRTAISAWYKGREVTLASWAAPPATGAGSLGTGADSTSNIATATIGLTDTTWVLSLFSATHFAAVPAYNKRE